MTKNKVLSWLEILNFNQCNNLVFQKHIVFQ